MENKELSIEESLNLIWSALIKSALNGSFDIDESYLIKLAFSKIKENINNKKVKE